MRSLAMHEAMLYNKQDDKKVDCYLCNRRCTIADGKLGYCQVRKNEKGILYSLVYGKACSANPDPIEKKPLWHFHPGSLVMSIATVGCNFRCQFCFHPETTIINNGITQKIGDVFEKAEKTSQENIRTVHNSYTVSATGQRRRLRKVFCHDYEGELLDIKASYLPPLKCTPAHEIYVWNGGITTKTAGTIQVGDSLIVPKLKSTETKEQIIEIARIIESNKTKMKKSRKTDEKKLKEIMRLKGKGLSSREIGKLVGMHPTYISTKDYWIVPVKRIKRRQYQGPVYNMEVEGEHSYLANFIGVANCQNWQISHERDIVGRNISPEKIIDYALDTGCTGISYTYTEPTIFFEYAYDTAKLAHNKGLFNTFVTNGYMTTDAVETIAPYLDAATVDFKGNANPTFYKNFCNVPSVDPIFESLKAMKAAGIHIEITNLLVSDVGDDTQEAETLAQWIVEELGEDTPLHILRFYPHHKMSNLPPTSIKKLEAAATAASRAGLKYVYLGNVPGHKGANTICDNCGALLIERLGIQTISVHLTRDGCCPSCNLPIPIKLSQDEPSSE